MGLYSPGRPLSVKKIPVFTSSLADVLAEEDEKEQESRKGDPYRHYPSSASIKLPSGKVIGGCLRAQYYRATKAPVSNETTLASEFMMGFGDGIHDWLGKKLQKIKGLTVMPESGGRVVIPELMFEASFRVDALVALNGKLGAIELKTINSNAFRYMDGKPKDDHLLQVISYFGLNSAIDWFSLMYFGRDTGFYTEFHITKEQEGGLADPPTFYCESVYPKGSKYRLEGFNFESVVQRWKELEEYLKKEEAPPRDFKAILDENKNVIERKQKAGYKYKSDYRCVYCAYKDSCWKEPGSERDAVQLVKTQYDKPGDTDPHVETAE